MAMVEEVMLQWKQQLNAVIGEKNLMWKVWTQESFQK